MCVNAHACTHVNISYNSYLQNDHRAWETSVYTIQMERLQWGQEPGVSKPNLDSSDEASFVVYGLNNSYILLGYTLQ